MIAWYVGISAVVVWAVFRDPRIDYRYVAAGSLAPLVVDGVTTGERAYAHSLVAAAGTLVVVVLATAGRRPARNRLVMLPIGMLLHLALDGMWEAPDTFWWPFLAGDVRGGSVVPTLVGAAWREAVGLVALAWFAARVGLTAPGGRERCRLLVRTGHVEVGP